MMVVLFVAVSSVAIALLGLVVAVIARRNTRSVVSLVALLLSALTFAGQFTIARMWLQT